MDINLSIYLIYGIPALALVIGLVKLFREIGLPVKFAPLASLVIGILAGIAVALTNGQTITQGVVIGICFGLSSSGIYDIGKKSNTTTTI
ncbi:MAG: hypothetical protein PHO87_04905 [Acholeplasmataceae bacterium]|jgi:flagellar biosynthesis protein FliR|nr:hypothetical protein [Acholeplasmataceae bacterium]MDD4469251.1 hypothetical protein [Acholeplasmataceae bacterium]